MSIEIKQLTDITDNIVYSLAIETAKLLIQKQDELNKINWTNGEANLDIEYSLLTCQCCCDVWNNIITKTNCEYDGITIECNTPDVSITFIYPNSKIIKKKIELKSSKSTKMPGSTIKNLDINQPMIYCLRPNNITEKYNIKCSQYHNAMGETNIDLFQDRTPRPFINFEKMKDIDEETPFENKKKDIWIEHYAKCALHRIHPSTYCQTSWQDDMLIIIKKNILNDFIRNTTLQEFKELKSYYESNNIDQKLEVHNS